MERTASFYEWRRRISADGELLRQALLCLLFSGTVRMSILLTADILKTDLPTEGNSAGAMLPAWTEIFLGGGRSAMLVLCLLFVLTGGFLAAVGRRLAGRILPAVVLLIVFVVQLRSIAQTLQQNSQQADHPAGTGRALVIVLTALILYWVSCAALRLGRLQIVPVLVCTALIIAGYARGIMPDVISLLSGLPLLLSELTGLRDRQPLRWLGAFLAFSLFLSILPEKSDPIDWYSRIERAQELLYEAGEQLDQLTYRFSEHLPSLLPEDRYRSGYSGLGTPGEHMDMDGADREELLIHTAGCRITLYLTGQIYDQYENGRFTHSRSGPQSAADPANTFSEACAQWSLDYLNALFQAGITPEEAATFSELHSMNIMYRFLRTRDLIRERSTLSVDADSAGLQVNGSNYEFDSRRGMDTAYATYFLVIDYANPLLEQILRDPPGRAGAPSYEELCEYYALLYGKSRALRLEQLISPEAYERWKNQPESMNPTDSGTASEAVSEPVSEPVSEQITALSETITAGLETDYDRARAIEQYLRANYRYSLSPGAASESDEKDADYIEEFLFTTREGYCVHYAAAMVRLLQAAGIQARYCEGYACRVLHRGPGEFSVMNSNAHAWPEVYLPGFGWVPFEPTSALPDAAATSWNRRVKEEESGSAALEEDAEWQNPYAAASAEAQETQAPDEPERPSLKEHPLYIPILTTLILILCIPLYLLIFILARRLVRRRHYRKLDETQRIRLLEEEIRELLQKLIPIHANPSLADYAACLADPPLQAELKTFIGHYEAVRFGARSVQPGWTGQAERLRRALQERYFLADDQSIVRKWIRHIEMLGSRRSFEEESKSDA